MNPLGCGILAGLFFIAGCFVGKDVGKEAARKQATNDFRIERLIKVEDDGGVFVEYELEWTIGDRTVLEPIPASKVRRAITSKRVK